MSSIETHFISDFIILTGKNANIFPIPNYNKVVIDENSVLYYLKSNVYAHFALVFSNEDSEIHLHNSFYPIFHYNNDNIEIYTPNYSHFLILNLPLTVEENNIKEFVLFNTPLKNHTFHKEVERLFNIEKIFIDSKIHRCYLNNESKQKKIYDIFIENIDKIANNTNQYKHGILLSGGGESRINAATAQAYNLNKDFITWGHPNDKEYIIASKIAKKLNTKIFNIRPDISDLPYKEILEKTGYLVNMQYAYRYAAVKESFSRYNYDVIWTGWGDINGYPTMYQPSELFSNYYLGLYNGERRLPAGWNKEWLMDYSDNTIEIDERVKSNPSNKTFFELNEKVFAPSIFGQVLCAENNLGTVIAPWFTPELYDSIAFEENKNQEIINRKYSRTLWKNELYYQLLRKYCPELNYLKNSKGYYPWLVRNSFGLAGLIAAAGFKKVESKRNYPFDPVENKWFIKMELENIIDDRNNIFNKDDIQEIIKNIERWKGNEIHAYFHLIQVYWFLNK